MTGANEKNNNNTKNTTQTQAAILVVVEELRTSSVPVGTADHEAHVVHLFVPHQALGQLRGSLYGRHHKASEFSLKIIQKLQVVFYYLPSNFVERDWPALVAGASSPSSSFSFSSFSSISSRLFPTPIVDATFSDSTAPPQDTADQDVSLEGSKSGMSNMRPVGRIRPTTCAFWCAKRFGKVKNCTFFN